MRHVDGGRACEVLLVYRGVWLGARAEVEYCTGARRGVVLRQEVLKLVEDDLLGDQSPEVLLRANPPAAPSEVDGSAHADKLPGQTRLKDCDRTRRSEFRASTAQTLRRSTGFGAARPPRQAQRSLLRREASRRRATPPGATRPSRRPGGRSPAWVAPLC